MGAAMRGPAFMTDLHAHSPLSQLSSQYTPDSDYSCD